MPYASQTSSTMLPSVWRISATEDLFRGRTCPVQVTHTNYSSSAENKIISQLVWTENHQYFLCLQLVLLTARLVPLLELIQNATMMVAWLVTPKQAMGLVRVSFCLY